MDSTDPPPVGARGHDDRFPPIRKQGPRTKTSLQQRGSWLGAFLLFVGVGAGSRSMLGVRSFSMVPRAIALSRPTTTEAHHRLFLSSEPDASSPPSPTAGRSSAAPPPGIARSSSFPIHSFEFAPNGVCVAPRFFFVDTTNTQKSFTMRNVPGDGDCMFMAVALGAATSLGLGANDALLEAISKHIRDVVAQILEHDPASSSNHNDNDEQPPSGSMLHIGKGFGVVSTKKLLASATRQAGLGRNTTEYLRRLRLEGKEGGLYGGGPELTVLSNVLRRPISVYELASEGGADNGPAARIECQGTFGDGLFEDPNALIPGGAAILSPGLQPGAYSWHLHILVLDVSPTEKHACVLLPQPSSSSSSSS